jgi:hypothetical protein
MPCTVRSILKAAGVRRSGVAHWGEPLARPPSGQPGTGIYIVALTSRTNRVDGCLDRAPVASAALDALLRRRPDLSIDGVRATRAKLAQRVRGFWLPDETVLYIGLAGSRKNHAGEELPRRVGEYATTRLGAKSPHSGGWPLLTLSNLRELYVHYGYCGNVDTVESAALGWFAGHASARRKTVLRDPSKIMPFANLEYPKGNRKDPGIKGTRGPVAPRELTPW